MSTAYRGIRLNDADLRDLREGLSLSRSEITTRSIPTDERVIEALLDSEIVLGKSANGERVYYYYTVGAQPTSLPEGEPVYTDAARGVSYYKGGVFVLDNPVSLVRLLARGEDDEVLAFTIGSTGGSETGAAPQSQVPAGVSCGCSALMSTAEAGSTETQDSGDAGQGQTTGSQPAPHWLGRVSL